MAIIKCTECGQMVSDKAANCPNCGCPVERVVVCEECGEHFKEGVSNCPKCGCPVDSDTTSNNATVAVRKNTLLDTDEELTQKVQNFIVLNKKYLPLAAMEEIRAKLLSLDKKQFNRVEWLEFKDPTTMIIISIVIGEFGIDRFLLGDISMGALKLILTLCCGIGLIWWLIDIFNIQEMTRDYNYQQLSDVLEGV
jgi:TM2 domain-containing membrane protein YozV